MERVAFDETCPSRSSPPLQPCSPLAGSRRSRDRRRHDLGRRIPNTFVPFGHASERDLTCRPPFDPAQRYPVVYLLHGMRGSPLLESSTPCACRRPLTG